jgi:hypothetical protein
MGTALLPDKFRKLSKTKALLLSGGALCSVFLAWFLATHRPVLDPAPAFTDRVLGAVTFIGRPDGVEALVAKLPEGALGPLEEAGFAEGNRLTLFAYLARDGSIRWGGIERCRIPAHGPSSGAIGRGLCSFGPQDHFDAIALGVHPEADDPRPAKRWIRRSADGFGVFFPSFAAYLTGLQPGSPAREAPFRSLPFLLDVSSGGFKLTAGMAYRGLALDDSFGRRKLRLPADFPGKALHFYSPSQAVTGRLFGQVAPFMQRHAGFADFPSVMGGSFEAVVSATAPGDALNPFIFYRFGRPLDEGRTATIVESLKNALGELFPAERLMRMDDGTEAVELGNGRSDITVVRRDLSVGTLYRFTDKAGNPLLALFDDHEGSAWISSSVDHLQSVMLINVGAVDTRTERACRFGLEKPGFRLVPGAVGGVPGMDDKILSVFSQNTAIDVVINNLETGLFTICGYF